MATPTYGAVSTPLAIPVNKPYTLEVSVAGNPTVVTAEGHFEGFSYRWDAANNKIVIKGTPKAIVQSRKWTLKAVNPDDATDIATKEITYNVVRSAPVIGTMSTIKLYKGATINVDIPITNNPPSVDVTGLLVGLSQKRTASGVNIFGDIPSAVGYTGLVSGKFKVVAGYAGGTPPSKEFNWTLETGSPPSMNAITLTANMGSSVRISFTAVTGAIAYEWTTGSGNNATWVKFTGTGNKITHTITGLTIGTTYTIRVRVSGPWVGTAVSRSVKVGSVPSAPRNVRFTNVTYSGGIVSGTITWQAPSKAGSTPITRYRVYAYGGGKSTLYENETGFSRTFSLTTGYGYRGHNLYCYVQAVNSIGYGAHAELNSTIP